MMQHADALSRALVNSIRISTLSWTEFEETQNLDKDILLVKRWVLNGRRLDKKPDDASPMLKSLINVFESLVVEKNLLCRCGPMKKVKERYRSLFLSSLHLQL